MVNKSNNNAKNNDKLIIFRVHEEGAHPRVVTIAYTYDREKQYLVYGASVFVRLNKEAFNKRSHRRTAEARYHKRPVIITGFKDEKNIHDLQQKIRRQLFEHGVKGKRL